MNAIYRDECCFMHRHWCNDVECVSCTKIMSSKCHFRDIEYISHLWKFNHKTVLYKCVLTYIYRVCFYKPKVNSYLNMVVQITIKVCIIFNSFRITYYTLDTHFDVRLVENFFLKWELNDFWSVL